MNKEHKGTLSMCILLVVCILMVTMLGSYFAGYKQAQEEIPTIANIEEVFNRYDARISLLCIKVDDIMDKLEEGTE